MNVPRMNWKRFISTGVLESRIPVQNNTNTAAVSSNRSEPKQSRQRQKATIKSCLYELTRLLVQNEAVIDALGNDKNPFHFLAADFIETQLYDSKALLIECEMRSKVFFNKADIQKKLKKLQEQINHFEKCRSLSEK